MTPEEKQILKKFGERVRQLRNKKGLTQQQLAELADLEYKYIQRIEGKNPPSIGLLKLLKIAKSLNVSLNQLIIL